MATAFIAEERRSALLASGFVASLQEPRTPYISPRRVAEALGIQLSRLAQIAGVHRNTLSNPASERLQDRLRDMIRVIMAATELTGDTERAIYWFRNEPILTLKRQTAAELVAAGHTDAVMLHLAEIVDGANG
ncbi:DUF2384 domain-containing protein [Sphingomonas mollis]|uniref:DUF2384 domain-containing protein n=1 Tax=Sphingomonas mollis TaxID=2795726 RepID=A0ABS0XUQ8_9SPHN|nr:DUF2384 domain-containing protein [Sphingomonas sp. BT553]MBJ6123758.1 DUF2384 domain-containing protein [Sphingomonas sp. BT553]